MKIFDQQSYVSELLEDIVKDHRETFDETQLRDFIDAFLLEIKNNSDKSFNVSLKAIRISVIYELAMSIFCGYLYDSPHKNIQCDLKYEQTVQIH